MMIKVLLALFLIAKVPAGSVLKLNTVSDNVSGAGEAIKINLIQWSSDMERDQFVAAWNMTASAAPVRGGTGGRGGGGQRGNRGGGAARGATASVSAPDLPADPDAVGPPAAARGGGGRGGGRGGATAATPAGTLLAALQNAPIAGYLWTSEIAGYSIRYAYRLPMPNGGQRIILATDRRLGATNSSWKPAAALTPNDYEFSLVELRLNAKGEGKISLIGKISIDENSKTISLEGYDAQPVFLKSLKSQF
jgi:hypothetical protein